MSLLPPDPADSHHVALFPLALALMGRDALDGDRLASVLEQPGLFRREDEWPDVDAVELGRQVLHRLDAGRVGRLLADAAVLSNGPVLLMDTLRLMHAARAHLPARLPQGLESLHELCVACTPVDPAPRVVTERTAPRWDEAEALATAEQLARQLFAATPVPGPPVLAPAAALRPPSTRGATANPHQVFRYAARIEQLNGNDLSNGLRLVLPRTGAELATWGQRLHNCLDDFIPAVTAGQSITIGVEQRGRLRYCLELTNGGVVRQFLGDRNRRVHTADAAPVIIALLTAGVLDRNADMNQPWMHIARGGLSATTDPWITGATRLFGSTQSPRARDTSPPSGAPDHHESRWTR